MTDTYQQLGRPKFPFVGIRSDGDPFEYLPIACEENCVSFAIYNWFVNRAVLSLGEQVDLLVPFFLKDKNFGSLQGTITSIQPNTALKAAEHALVFPGAIEIVPVENWCLESFLAERALPSIGVLDLLLKLVKDTALLKSGVCIYLKHLRAYFSRISLQPAAEYLNLNTFLLSDIEKRVKENENHLKNLTKQISSSLKSVADIPLFIQLEDLREIVESEIPFSLISLALHEGQPGESATLFDLLTPRFSNQSIAYLHAVKILEKRLYINYNTIVLIYSYALNAILPPD